MHFIMDHPQSTTTRYTGTLLIIDPSTKVAIYLNCRKAINSPELVRMFSEHVICKYGVPDTIVTDRGEEFPSRSCNRVPSHINIYHRLSTAFCPQTDGQTERHYQIMEQYLPAFPNYEQDDWVELLPLPECAYNYSVHHSTRMTPFWANYHDPQPMPFKSPKI